MFNWVSMPKICPHFETESWAIDFAISFLINFGIVCTWPMYQRLYIKGVGL